MRETKRRQPVAALTRLTASLAALAFGVGAQAANLTINVVDGTGAAVPGFKYLVQEDTTYQVDPGNTLREDMLSFNFHRSNHPPALSTTGAPLSGHSNDQTSVTLPDVADGHYYVSVLPYSGYSMSGQQVAVSGTDATATVTVATHPIPTAQIAIFLFEDNYPLNGTPDLPEEENTSTADGFVPVDFSQFSVTLEDPAGLYGQQGGPVLQDAFGNPLGTTYDADGNVLVKGDGTLHPDADGYLLVQNLAPGKYGVIVNPPLTAPAWQQTSTIEGTIVIDAWVKANEPPFFVEFGLPGPHVFMGFVRTDRVATNLLAGGATVSGTITDMHMSRSPDFTFYSGRPFPQCWVALNQGIVVPGRTLWVAPCDGNSGFSVSGVPDGEYTLEIFDANLDAVIAMQPLTVAGTGTTCNGGNCDLGEVPVFNWFSRLNTAVFNDLDQDGFWDANEGFVGPEGGPVAIRWANGTIYQTFPTDGEGFAPFDEVFPFFHWLVAEVGFGNKKATGATFVVDAGGGDPASDPPVLFADQGWDFPSFDELNPQPQFCTPAQVGDPAVSGDGVAANCDLTAHIGNALINPNTGNNLSRTEKGQVLTQAFQGFLGQTSVMQFGKAEYIDYDKTSPLPFNWTFVGENGGISGVIQYATTRAENDPRYAVADTWEPGIPRVQVALYADGDIDCDTNPAAGAWPNGACDIDWDGDGVRDPNTGTIADLNGNGGPDLADVDNYPLNWAPDYCVPVAPATTCPPGPEDIDRDGNDTFDLGDALQVAWSDSWDDNPPTGCQGQNQIDIDLDGTITPEEDSRCFDGLRSFNQVRPGVFDGGWAFADYDLTHLPGTIATKLSTFYTTIRNRSTGPGTTLGDKLPETWMLPGDYIVAAATPPGYTLVKEESKNVDFGDEYAPIPQAVDVPCVGDPRTVPPLLSFATKDGSGLESQVIPAFADAVAPFAGETRPLCDRKAVSLAAAQNAATNFFFYTETPIAANATGMVLNDLANEFNPNSPAFGEKYAPPYVPVAFYDWAGKQVARVYADEFGRYNTPLPSTYSANLPMPSGFSPNMLVSCMNDAGPIPNPDPTGPELIIDPNFDPAYSQFCYTFQYMPGAATYLDTPVVSIAAFANPPTFPVDCEQPQRTPMIASVERHSASRPIGAVAGSTGPFVVAGGTVAVDQQIIVRSLGQVSVPNPDWDGTLNTPKNITRDYRFAGPTTGLAPLVHLEDANGNPTPLTITGWNANQITANVPRTLAPGEYQVVVTRQAGVPAPGVRSPIGVTLTVGRCSNISTGQRCSGTENGVRPDGGLYAVHAVTPAPYPATPIQDAIDAAAAGDLILVAPGSYEELVIQWKPVKLQGWGAGRVTLNARQVPTEKINAWRTKAQNLIDGGLIDPLPGQELLPGGFAALGAAVFPTEEGAGIFVAGLADPTNLGSFSNLANQGARIDGFTIVGATQGGGIVLNGYAGHMNIANNRLYANAGFYGGGIRLGHPTLSHEDPDAGLVYDDAMNDNVRIHHNLVIKNGNTIAAGVGGGMSLHTGSDGYQVQKNWMCGNFSQGSGAGIGHLGFSNDGLIEDNTIVFNESFSQAGPESGGGIYIGGQPALQATAGLLVSPGAGTVTIDANLIRGNLAGAGDGGGIRLENVNGADVAASPDNVGPWSDIYLFNNLITNNVAGLAGGGVSIENTVSASFRYNTIANNDSTATTALAFSTTNPNLTDPQPAGIVSRAHSGAFGTLMTRADVASVATVYGNDQTLFSNPELRADIVYNNRSLFWLNYDDPATPTIETGLFPANCFPDQCNPADQAVAAYSRDLAVLGTEDPSELNPTYSMLTDITDYPGAFNISVSPPGFIRPYFNGPRDDLNIPEFTTLQTAGAFDEGGNFIQVTFGPLTLIDTSVANQRTLFDYHLRSDSLVINRGGPILPYGDTANDARQRLDFDNQVRPGAGVGGSLQTDIGADERR